LIFHSDVYPFQITPAVVDRKPLATQQQQQQQQQQQPDQDRPMTFEEFIHLHPKHAETKFNQLSEITGKVWFWFQA
jgi:hypothetical protein